MQGKITFIVLIEKTNFIKMIYQGIFTVHVNMASEETE